MQLTVFPKESDSSFCSGTRAAVGFLPLKTPYVKSSYSSNKYNNSGAQSKEYIYIYIYI